MFKFD